MRSEDNRLIAKELLARIGTGASPNEIAGMFSEDVVFAIPGDVGALPWIGRRTGRSAVEAFITENRLLIRPERFTVDEVLASETRAVILGSLAGVVAATGRLIETDFVMVLTLSDGGISKFEMLEDSFAVSAAARA